ncbi:MAG: NADH-quinone oxidoreductase subunit N [Bacteroidota bacterium]
MDIPISVHDLLATAPITIVSLTALFVLIVESIVSKSESVTAWLALIGLFAAMVSAFTLIQTTGTAYVGMVTTGGYASFFAIVFCLSGILSIMLSKMYIRRQGIEHGEYYALLLFAVIGMMLMAAAADLIVFFLGLELMSVCFYVLAGFARKRVASNEAALKYFLLGAFATGFLLYGIALVYGCTGTTNIELIIQKGDTAFESKLFLIGLGLLVVGLGFKIAGVPFHMWVPDVYEGSPTTVSGFMSTGGKAAAFSAILLIFAPKMINAVDALRDVLAAIATLSMIVGNVLAISQNNIKRMLAYSSIAHAGYILVGVIAANEAGANGVLFYLLAYTVMNVGAFGILSVGESREGEYLTFEDYTGLSTQRPLLAGLMALFMFSLAGIPPFAGFFGKYYVFAGAVEAGYTWLAVVGVLMSAVSAYYYLKLVVVMYFKEGVSTMEAPVPALSLVALVVSAIGLLGLGIFPSVVLKLTEQIF